MKSSKDKKLKSKKKKALVTKSVAKKKPRKVAPKVSKKMPSKSKAISKPKGCQTQATQDEDLQDQRLLGRSAPSQACVQAQSSFQA